MNSLVDILPIILIAIILWLIGLSVVFFMQRKHYLRLTKKAGGGNIQKLLESVLDSEAINKRELAKVSQEIENIKTDGHLHIQKIGLVRFNPFDETGGDQSFALAILDRKDSGIIITGLHTRDRTRVYVKPISKGKSSFTVSKEERKAITIATKK